MILKVWQCLKCFFTIIIRKGRLGLEQIWFPNPPTLLYNCTTSLIIIWNILPLWTWYYFMISIEMLSKRRYERTLQLCIQCGWRPLLKDQSSTLLKGTSNSQWIIHSNQDSTWCLWPHTQVGTHIYRMGKKWPLSKVSAVESQTKVATCGLKVGALETGWSADKKFTGLHTMNDWRQEAAGKPNHWVSIFCLFLKYLM